MYFFRLSMLKQKSRGDTSMSINDKAQNNVADVILLSIRYIFSLFNFLSLGA